MAHSEHDASLGKETLSLGDELLLDIICRQAQDAEALKAKHKAELDHYMRVAQQLRDELHAEKQLHVQLDANLQHSRQEQVQKQQQRLERRATAALKKDNEELRRATAALEQGNKKLRLSLNKSKALNTSLEARVKKLEEMLDMEVADIMMDLNRVDA